VPDLSHAPVANAHAAATIQQLFGDRFRFGICSGELLNEHVVGARWPAIEVRLEMLEEAMIFNAPHLPSMVSAMRQARARAAETRLPLRS
jgi:hypothetical protein